MFYLNTNPVIKNMENTGYCKTLDENFSLACELISRTQSHAELINMLKNGNIVEKQLAALKLDTVNSKEEAQILLNNLTGQDGKVRETVSAKIAELAAAQDKLILFNPVKNYQKFLESIIDINGNICRNIISTLENLTCDKEFCSVFVPELIKKSLELALKVQNFDLQEGKYKINKEVFKLYWYLETIYVFAASVNTADLKNLLNSTKSINEYTIREKTAKILSKNFNDKDLDNIRQLLKNDTNYYVRRF